MRALPLLIALIGCGNCANILVISTLPSHSHHFWNEAYSLGLVDKGHNVTMVTHDETKVKRVNYTNILLEGIYDQPFDFESFTYMNSFQLIGMMMQFNHHACLHDVQTEGFRTLMSYPEDFKFDLIAWDVISGHCLYPLISRFGDPPVVGLSPFGLQHILSQHFGNQIPFYPFYLGRKPLSEMGFLDRLQNHFLVNVLTWTHKLLYEPAETEVAKRVFPNIDFDRLCDYDRKATLLLTNSDPVWDYAMPTTPNIVEVGGLHIPKPKKLPADLQKLLDSASEGVIYMALGSNLKAEQLTKLELLFRELEKLPHKIVWKIDVANLNFKLPANVVAKKWCPQNDILAHKNVIMFISHGGSLSTQEAVYNGVPMLIIPFFLDQYSNAIRLVSKNVATQVPYTELAENDLYAAAMKVLQDPSYRANALRLSRLFKDRLNTPLETAVFWTEYVLKYGYLDHLDVVNRDMYFYETIHLDVILFVLIALLLVLVLICAMFYCCCCRKSRNTRKMKAS